MNRIAIAFLTKDRVELTERSIEPLLQPDKFDLHWIDGSSTEAGREYPLKHTGSFILHRDIRGGSGPAIVYALTALLKDYDYIGLCENDVLLPANWFNATMSLFEQGRRDGFLVGAVSARCYQDRILFQRDGYAVMHNLGAGMVIFSRAAAEIVLRNYRTTFTTENRCVFAQLSGVDIGAYWAFRDSQHWLVADWGFDRVLAQYGFASLALTPSRVQMIDQDIAPLGLQMADGKFKLNDKLLFGVYRDGLCLIDDGSVRFDNRGFFAETPDGGIIVFAHQILALGGQYSGNWRIRDFLGFGPFVWRAGDGTQSPKLTFSVTGHCVLMVSGGRAGGKIKVEELETNASIESDLPDEDRTPNLLEVAIPAISYAPRKIVLTALSPGICFFGLRCREPQLYNAHTYFNHWTLPPP